MALKREQTFLKRHFLKAEQLERGSKKLPDLKQQDHVYDQDQTGPSPKSWSKSGKILECLPHNSYLIKLDSSGNHTKKKQAILEKVLSFTEILKEQHPPQVASNFEIGTMDDILDTPLAATIGLFEMGQQVTPNKKAGGTSV